MEFKDAVNTLLSGFQGMIDKAIEAAPFDKTYRGRIVAVDGNKYSVQINGTIHEIKTSKIFSEGEYVNVLVPKNDWNKALISDQGKIEMPEIPEIPEIPEVTLSSLLPANAGAHNSIFRGQNLGSSVTDEQWAEIKAGTFTNLFIGDYWVINGIAWEIAAFDYYLYGHLYTAVGVPAARHNVIIVPYSNLYSARMNTTSTTEGGYTGSAMFTTNLEAAKTTINNAFGSAHILSHSVYLVKAVSNGIPSGGAWTDVTVDLMNEQMVYGGPIFGPTNAGTTIPCNHRVEKTQLPLFALAPSHIQQREYPNRDFSYWLKDVVSATQFATVGDGGIANYSSAYSSLGVRPYFSIYQE